MFAGIELALRIDTAAARLSRSVSLGVAVNGSAPPPFAMPLGAGFAVFGKKGAPTNKVIGIGIDKPIALDELLPIEEAYRARGECVRFELSTLANPQAGELLTSRGYKLQGFENVLGLDLRATAPGQASPEIVVERAGQDELTGWLNALVDGFAAPDTSGVPAEVYPRELIEEVSRDFARGRDVIRYTARLAGAEAFAGGASMWLDQGIGEMCGAATRPEFRRRGVQQALFQRRIDDARAAGCDVAVVTTAPGTQSQANAEKRGFRLLYARAVLVRTF